MLEDRHGVRRPFALRPAAFLIDGEVVTLVRPTVVASTAAVRSASGSIAVPDHRAVVARGSRIWVEGLHDAELVEKVWGHDLRVEGVVVEPLTVPTTCPPSSPDSPPGRARRLGVLLDHLVAGSKETRLAARASGQAGTLPSSGHPYVDVWQAVDRRPSASTRGRTCPGAGRGRRVCCAALGWPARHAGRHRGRLALAPGHVRTYADLEPSLLARVEELVDVVTAPD